MKRPVQYFKEEDLETGKDLSPTQISKFLEDFRQSKLESIKENKLISMRVDNFLLEAFKRKCENEGVKYQKKIRQLMQNYLIE